jgi:hypothetical protein
MNVPTFLSKESPQYKYDYFMALKHNISVTKLLAVLIHRLCGNYDERFKSSFTDKFKQLKQWLFRSYRTEDIPQVAYTTLWKSWTIYRDTQEKKIATMEKYYDIQIDDLYPEEERMYVSLTPITQPVYYLYKPEKIVMEANHVQNQEPVDLLDIYGNPIIPEPVRNEMISLRTIFEYGFRNYCSPMLRCECCRGELFVQTIAMNLRCTHVVHTTCLESYTCPLCE